MPSGIDPNLVGIRVYLYQRAALLLWRTAQVFHLEDETTRMYLQSPRYLVE
jgi:hypothetical protein